MKRLPAPNATTNARQKREGAALFVVMMILMVGTVSAVFSASTVAHEVRGTGFARQQMQTRYAAKAALYGALDWIDIYGAGAIRGLMLNPGANHGIEFDYCPTTGTVGTCYPEVNMTTGRRAYRLYGESFTAQLVGGGRSEELVNPPVDRNASFGVSTALDPIVTVDFYDEHMVNKLAPGVAAQGGTKFKYMRMTLTARAVARIPGDVANVEDSGRQRNETAAGFRAFIVSGPIDTGS